MGKTIEKTKELNHTTGEQKLTPGGLIVLIIIVVFLFGMCNGLSQKETKRTHEENLQFIIDCERFEQTKLGRFIKKAEGR